MRRVIACAALLALGCGEPSSLDEAPADAQGPPWVEVGTGSGEFTALDGCPPVPIVAGHQGAYHIVVSARADGIDPVGAELDFTLSRDGRVVGGTGARETLIRGPAGHHLWLGGYAVFDDHHPERHADREAQLAVRLRDRGGLELYDSACIRPTWSP